MKNRQSNIPTSLGPKYAGLRTVVNALDPAKRTLPAIMQMAIDHLDDNDNDEQETGSTALVAQLKREGYKIEAPNARARTWGNEPDSKRRALRAD